MCWLSAEQTLSGVRSLLSINQADDISTNRKQMDWCHDGFKPLRSVSWWQNNTGHMTGVITHTHSHTHLRLILKSVLVSLLIEVLKTVSLKITNTVAVWEQHRRKWSKKNHKKQKGKKMAITMKAKRKKKKKSTKINMLMEKTNKKRRMKDTKHTMTDKKKRRNVWLKEDDVKDENKEEI